MFWCPVSSNEKRGQIGAEGPNDNLSGNREKQQGRKAENKAERKFWVEIF